MMIRSSLTAALALWLATGCDPSAKAQGGAASGELSREYETCGATNECEPGLRCVDQVCRAQASAIIGDYYAASGARLLGARDVKGAVKAYGEAVNQYKAANQEPPLALYCAQGHALALAANDQELAEVGARVLHRCAQAAPVGSAMRQQALLDLAVLGEHGLDPVLLATDAADKYMTKGPKRPASDDVKLVLSSDVSTSAASYSAFLALFGNQAMRDKLLPCWEAFAESSGKDTLAFGFGFKYRFVRGKYESEDGYRLSMQDAVPSPDPAVTAAAACAKPHLEALVDGFKEGSGRWDGNVTFTLAP